MLSLALALLAQSTSDELSLGWQTTYTESYGEPGSALGLVAGGTRTIGVLGNEAGDAYFLNAYDEQGSDAWSVTLEIPPGWAFHELALSPDANTAFLLSGLRANNQRVLRLEAYRASDGQLLWQTDEPFWALDSFFGGDLDVSSDRVAVLATLGASGSLLEEVRLTVHSTQDGSVVAQSGVLTDTVDRVTLAPSGNSAVLWNEDGRMDLRATETAASLWAVDVATAPGGATGVTELIFDGSEARVVRADGLTASAYDVADGSLQWTFAGLDAREVVAYSTDRVFACGVDGAGSLSGGIQRYAMLEASTGQVLWDGFQVEDIGSLSLLTVQRWTALSDEANGLVAFRDSELYVFDAETGALVGLAPLASGGSSGSLGRMAGNRWVALYASLFGTGGRMADAFLDGGSALWSLDWEFPLPLTPFSPVMDLAANGTELHARWMFNPAPFQAPGNGRYEVLDAETGAPLRGFFLPANTFLRGHDVSPDGTRFSMIDRQTQDTAVLTFDTHTGLEVGNVEYENEISDLNDRDLVWNSDGTGFAATWEKSGSLSVAKFNPDGQVQWKRNFVHPSSDETRTPKLAWEPATGNVILAHSARLQSGFQWVFGVTVMDAQTGVTVKELNWNDGADADFPGYEPISLGLDPELGRLHVVMEVSEDFDERIQVLSVDLNPLSVVGDALVLPADVWTQAIDRGISFSSDFSRVLVATRGDIGGLVAGALLHDVNLETLELTQTKTFDAGGFNSASDVRHLSDGLVAMRLGPQFDDQDLLLLDAESLEVYENLGPTGDVLETGSLVPMPFDSGWALALFGVPYTVGLEVDAQRWDVAPLLATPNEITTAGGPVDFLIGAGAEHAAQPFLLLGSASGTEPGFVIDGVPVPLVFDPYTRDSIVLAGSGPFAETLGVLDGEGEGLARLNLPGLDPGLIGLSAHHAAVTFGAGFAADFVTQPVSLTLVP